MAGRRHCYLQVHVHVNEVVQLNPVAVVAVLVRKTVVNRLGHVLAHDDACGCCLSASTVERGRHIYNEGVGWTGAQALAIRTRRLEN